MWVGQSGSVIGSGASSICIRQSVNFGRWTKPRDILCNGADRSTLSLSSTGLNLCRLYSLPPSELYYKHEAYILNLPSTASSIQKNLSLEVLKELKSIVQREQQLAAMNTNGGAGGVGVGGSGTSGGGAAKGTPKAGGAMGMRKALGGNGDLGGL